MEMGAPGAKQESDPETTTRGEIPCLPIILEALLEFVWAFGGRRMLLRARDMRG